MFYQKPKIMRVKFYLLLLISICCFPVYGQKSIDVPYDFPIKPGTEKWKEFKTGEEMVAASIKLFQRQIVNFRMCRIAKDCTN